jgi:predicted nucleic acid-binding Zn ribbon protein
MEENIRLRDAVLQKPREKTAKLGDVVSQLLESRISPQQAKFSRLADAWRQLLPVELQKHCRLSGIGGGQLKVTADSSAYVYELQLCSTELVAQLREECPSARIEKIKVTLG